MPSPIKKSSPKGFRLTTKESFWEYFRHEAARRSLEPHQLISVVLATIANDDMIRAVLDDEEEG